MAKKTATAANRTPLDDLDDPIDADTAPETTVHCPLSTVHSTSVQVSLPLGELPNGVYLCRHVEVQLDQAHRVLMRRLLVGLQSQHAHLANGRHVENLADVLRYVLDQVQETTRNAE